VLKELGHRDFQNVSTKTIENFHIFRGDVWKPAPFFQFHIEALTTNGDVIRRLSNNGGGFATIKAAILDACQCIPSYFKGLHIHIVIYEMLSKSMPGLFLYRRCTIPIYNSIIRNEGNSHLYQILYSDAWNKLNNSYSKPLSITKLMIDKKLWLSIEEVNELIPFLKRKVIEDFMVSTWSWKSFNDSPRHYCRHVLCEKYPVIKKHHNRFDGFWWFAVFFSVQAKQISTIAIMSSQQYFKEVGSCKLEAFETLVNYQKLSQYKQHDLLIDLVIMKRSQKNDCFDLNERSLTSVPITRAILKYSPTRKPYEMCNIDAEGCKNMCGFCSYMVFGYPDIPISMPVEHRSLILSI